MVEPQIPNHFKNKPYKKSQVCVLVVEDDNFQRLGLLDLLDVLKYKFLEASNGIAALEILNKDENKVDLVLLDVYMPQMGGLELLQIMKQSPKLKDIPIVMMSADGESDIIAQFLRNGAQDYLIKPIKYKIIDSLVTYVNLSKNPHDSTGSRQEYTFIKELGSGTSGVVQLVHRKRDGQEFSMKVMNLEIMDPVSRTRAENESVLLKRLVGPGVIRYYDSFKENEYLYILMEYAQKGSLRNVIEEQKKSGKFFEIEQILQWVAELVVGLALIHSKNILHRDIKAENIFLTKTDQLKIGDFGISKESQQTMKQTIIGTLYTFSPELCDAKPYGKKSDIWALGVVIYEILTLNKPFNPENIFSLMTKIKIESFDPLPEYVIPDLRQLVSDLLEKEPEKRPSSIEIAKRDFLKPYIHAILAACEEKEIVDAFLNMVFLKSINSPLQSPESANWSSEKNLNNSKSSFKPKSEKKEEEMEKYRESIKNLEEIANWARGSLILRDVKTGFFSSHSKCFSGSELFKLLSERFPQADTIIRTQICQDLITHNFIHPVNNGYMFSHDSSIYYVFQCDKQTTMQNMLKNWYGQCRGALTVSGELIRLLNKVVQEVKGVTINRIDIPANYVGNSKEYKRFLEGICELQKVELSTKKMGEDEILAFFLNVYQIMKTHRIIKSEIELKEANKTKVYSKGLFASIFKIVPLWKKENDDFIYKIGNLGFSIAEIRDGILRGNRKSANFKGFPASDPKLAFVQKKDPRYICVIGYDSRIEQKLEEFKRENLQKSIDDYCRRFLSYHVQYNFVDSEIILPKCFDNFKEDLGENQLARLIWMLQYVNNINPNALIKKVEENPNSVIYSEDI